MSPITLSIIVLALLFLGTIVERFHIGLTALPAAVGVGLYGGLSVDDITAQIPSEFLILLIGVTAFFAVAQVNGTMDWLLSRSLAIVHGRRSLLPWLVFSLMAVVTAFGTLPTAGLAIMAPIALGLAWRYKISPLVMALMMVGGYLATTFSPLAVFGLTAARLYEHAEVVTALPVSVTLTAASFGVCFLLCGACYLIGGKSLRAVGIPESEGTGGTVDTQAPPQIETVSHASGGTVDTQAPPQIETVSHASGGTVSAPEQVAVSSASEGRNTGINRNARIATLIGFAALVIGGIGFKLDLGYLALTLTVVLQLFLRLEPSTIIAKIPWNIVVLIIGILTYIGVMEQVGTFTWMSEALSVATSPILSLLVICYLAGVMSFFASSVAVLATVIPLLPPLVESGLSPGGALIAVALSCVLVDINPLGITGGLILGSTAPEDRARLYRQLLTFGLCSVVISPMVVWAIFGWL